MKALTLWQPWASLIMEGYKPLENRYWAPPDNLIGKVIALHAGKTYDEDAVQFEGAEDAMVHAGSEFRTPRGAILGVARLSAVIAPHDVKSFLRILKESQLEWWDQEQFAWIFRDRKRLSAPIPCRGLQGLWTVPADIEAKIWEHLK